jgi:spore photoproduct lyase
MKTDLELQLIQNFDRVYIHTDSAQSKLAARLQKLFSEDKIEFVSEDPTRDHKGLLSKEQFNQSKRRLYVHPFKGHFFKRCPGATQKKTLTCCNYYVLNLGQQCNFNCSYCYLQSYLKTPMMHMYSNIEDAIQELEDMAQSFSHHPFRVGTGEVIDSLSLDPLSLFSHQLIEFFRKYPKWTLEFKTKSNHVEHFLNLPHAGNVVVSWSVNAREVTAREEHGTASLEQRLSAAEKCRDAGFPVAFHIDPVIWYPEWKTGYRELVDQICSRFKPEHIHVISVGTLRFQPEQRYMMKERFTKDSFVNRAEMFLSDGGKYRYDSRLRQEMYEFILSRFKQNSNSEKNWKIFLCMETPETWIESFESHPMQVPGLKDFFRPLPKIKSEGQQHHQSQG